MYQIYIDIGNTFTKYTTPDSSEVFQIRTQILEKTSDLNKLEIWQAIAKFQNEPVSIYVSCVRQGLAAKISAYFGNKAQVKFLNFKNQNIIKIKDQKQNHASDQIGSDIIANAIASNELSKDVIVISLGTAIVYFKMKNATIEGVAIDAGFELSLKAFLQKVWGKDTTIWPTISQKTSLLGLNTDDAISSGFINSKVFAINGFIKNLQNPKTKIIITGGDYQNLAMSLKKHLQMSFEYQADLVLQGLKIWAKKA